MTPARAAAVLFLLATIAAALLAFASRAPEEIRAAAPGPGATDPSLGASFTDAQVARHGAYRGAAYLGLALSTILEIAALVLLARALMPRAGELLQRLPGGWPVRAAAAALFVGVVLSLVALPIGLVRTLGIDRAWGLSTQDFGGWLSDAARALAVGAVVSAVAAISFFGLVRAFPRTWWLWGWLVFTALTAALTFLFPIVIAPLFNKFTPVEEPGLRTRVMRLADQAGVDLNEVVIADASKRTTAENAYVAGIGGSKRMVLYDTLVAAGDEDETAYVVAHELGHESRSHILKSIAVSSAGLLVGFLLLAWLGGRPGVWRWAGAEGIGDIRALPVLALVIVVLGLVALPLENAISRRFEREADEVAISLTRDPDTAVRVFRRLAFSNLADLRPPRAAELLLFSHPSIPDRIEAARSVAENAGTP